MFSLVVRAFFAGSETAFLAMDKWAVDSLANEGDERALLLKKMKENSKNTVSALLVGTNICTILFSVLAVSLSYAIGLEGPAYLGLVSLLTTAVVFVFSDLMPKTFAAKAPTHVALSVAVPLDVSLRILSPAAYLIGAVPSLLTSLFSRKRGKVPDKPQEEVLTVLDMAEENGYVKPEDKDVIDSIFDIKDKKVKDIMTPFENVVAFEPSTTILTAIESFKEHGYVMGVLYIKDAVGEVVRHPENGSLPITSIMREPYIVNASDSILKVLSRLKKDKVHMAIVMQGSSPVGIVTMQDLIEELIGDISEEVRSHNVILLQYSGRLQ